MNACLRFAICGIGLAGQRHVEAMAQLAGIELVAAVEPGDMGKKFALCKGLPIYDELPALLDEMAIDGVILATPTPLHVSQAMICVARRCPVLVEKPLAESSQEAEGLVEAARLKNVPLLVGHHRRHNPLVKKAKETITSGAIGEVRLVQAACWLYKPDQYFDEAPWRKKVGAGPISVNLVHDVDLIRHLCGEITHVQAVARASRRGFENEELAGAVFELDNGAVGTISVADSVVSPWSWELTSRECQVYAPTSENCYLIGGTKASLSVPDLRLWSHQDGQGDWMTAISAMTLKRDISDPLVNQISHFADVIRGKAEPLVSGEEGLRSLRVIEAIQQAANSGRRVSLFS